MINYEVPYGKIVYFPGVLENVDALMEKIEITNSIAVSPWGIWYANSDVNAHAYGELKTFTRSLMHQETDPDLKAACIEIIDTLVDSMSKAAKAYAEIHNIDQDDLDYALSALNQEGTRFGINKYYEKEFMGPHVDWNEFNSEITYTIVVYLNDDYEGGELYFVDPEIDIKIKPVKGSIVMFPSVLPYLHQSCEITAGRKMLITHHWKTNPKYKTEQSA